MGVDIPTRGDANRDEPSRDPLNGDRCNGDWANGDWASDRCSVGAVLARRAVASRAAAEALHQRAQSAMSEAAATVASAVVTRLVARRARAYSRPADRAFLLEGLIDGIPVRAVVRQAQLYVSRELHQRADLLVRMGEFVSDGRGDRAPASLQGPLIAVMTTLIRACDRAQVVEIGCPRPGPTAWAPLPPVADGYSATDMVAGDPVIM